MKQNPPTVNWIHNSAAYFDWSWQGCGFGQLSFSFDREKNEITCMNECMGRERVREILHAYADFIADHAILEDQSEDEPHQPMPTGEPE